MACSSCSFKKRTQIDSPRGKYVVIVVKERGKKRVVLCQLWRRIEIAFGYNLASSAYFALLQLQAKHLNYIMHPGAGIFSLSLSVCQFVWATSCNGVTSTTKKTISASQISFNGSLKCAVARSFANRKVEESSENEGLLLLYKLDGVFCLQSHSHSSSSTSLLCYNF